MDSYFSIYHYVMQRCITKRENDTKQEDKIKYEDDLLKNHGYTKDFVKLSTRRLDTTFRGLKIFQLSSCLTEMNILLKSSVV